MPTQSQLLDQVDTWIQKLTLWTLGMKLDKVIKITSLTFIVLVIQN